MGHYVLLTALLPQDEIGLFDPYDDDEDFPEPGRREVKGLPKQMNRAVLYPLLNRSDRSDYAMGELSMRENLLIWRTDAPFAGATSSICAETASAANAAAQNPPSRLKSIFLSPLRW